MFGALAQTRLSVCVAFARGSGDRRRFTRASGEFHDSANDRQPRGGVAIPVRIRNAIVRLPAANFASGITAASLGTPSFENACEQHAAYRTALSVAGATVTVLEPDPRHPDAHFVEDVAVVLDAEWAVLTRPGASARAGEVASIRRPLERFFETLDAIEPPGTLDGGDVCDAGDRAYIGLSQRTNAAGATELANLFARVGKDSAVIDVLTSRNPASQKRHVVRRRRPVRRDRRARGAHRRAARPNRPHGSR